MAFPFSESGGYCMVFCYYRSSSGRITQRYTGSDITVSLRNQQGGNTGLTVDDISTFTIWCQRFTVFFSRIKIPQGLMLESSVSVGHGTYRVKILCVKM